MSLFLARAMVGCVKSLTTRGDHSIRRERSHTKTVPGS